jgi:hypothetical protein
MAGGHGTHDLAWYPVGSTLTIRVVGLMLHNTGGMNLTFAASRSLRSCLLDCNLLRVLLRAPTGAAGPSKVAVGRETCLLSLSTTIRLLSR